MVARSLAQPQGISLQRRRRIALVGVQAGVRSMSAFAGKADVTQTCADVCFWYKAEVTPVTVTHCTPARLGVTNSTIFDPKCDIVFTPDVILGAGEAMRRRESIAFVGSTAAAWPLVAHAQKPGIGVPSVGDTLACFG